VSDNNNEINNCTDMFDVVTICVGDKVEVTLKGTRSTMALRGVIVAVSNHALSINSRGTVYGIRYSEIKMVRKLK